MPPDRTMTRNTTWVLVGLGLVFLVVWNTPPLHALQGVPIMTLPLHMFAEMLSIIVALMVFGIVWNATIQDRSGSIVIIGCLLLAVGFIDFVHMLSSAGMPDFVTSPGPEKAINFWLAARLLFALGLLAVAFRKWTPRSSRSGRYLLVTASLVVPAVVTWLGLFRPEIWPHTFLQGQGLTAFKVGAEYVIVAILLVAAVQLYLSGKRTRNEVALGLFAAAVVTIMSELSFTLYSDVADIFNLLGHLYKIVAYVIIYQTVFVACVREPFERLHTELEENLRISKQLTDHKASLLAEIDVRTQAEREILSYSEKLSRSNRDQEDFAMVAAHDLQEPLRKAEVFADRISMSPDNDLSERALDDLGRLRGSVERMRRLVDDLLSYAQVSADPGILESVDLEALAHKVVVSLQEAVDETGGEVHIGPLPVVEADSAQMSRLLRHLVSNGLKFHKPGIPPIVAVEGHIVVDDILGGTQVCRITVRDSGIGFDESYADQIFSMFKRLHGVGEYRGTGIGLAVCRRVVERHDGAITATSTPGEGSTFVVRLPVTRDT